MYTVSLAQTNGIIVPSGNEDVAEMIVDKQQKYFYCRGGSTVVMWDMKTGLQLYTFNTQVRDVSSMQISGDGTKLVVDSRRGLKIYSTLDGKEIYKRDAGLYYGCAFSADGNKLYVNIDDYPFKGILEINLKDGKEKKLFSDEQFNTYKDLTTINEEEWISFSKKGWRIFDLAKNEPTIKIELPLPDKGVDGYEPYRQFRVLANQEYVLMYEKFKVYFYELRTGKLLKTMDIANQDYKLISSTDGKQFGLSHFYRHEGEVKLYNSKTFAVEKVIDPRITNLADYANDVNVLGIDDAKILADKRQILMARRGEVFLVDVAKSTILKRFRRQIEYTRNIGYNAQRQTLNFVAADSIYRSVDMKRFIPTRNKSLGIMTYEDFTFSNGGDTVSIFPYDVKGGKGYLKNVKTGKKTPLNFTTRDPEGANSGQPDFFLSKDGLHGYVYTTLLARYDRFTKIIHRVDLKTGVRDQPITYAGDVVWHKDYLDIDREILSVYTELAATFTLKTWNLRTGKLMINKTYPKTAWLKDNSPRPLISGDGKKIAYFVEGRTEFYSLLSGALLAQTNFSPYLSEHNFFMANSNLSQIFYSYPNGKIQVVDSAGKKLYELKEVKPGNLRLSPDDKVLYNLDDLTVWNALNGNYYGRLYLFREENDYVFLDEQGRFDGTPVGIKKLYYLKGRSVIPLDVVYERYYTPNLYARLLNGETFEPINMIIKPVPLAKISYAAVQRNLDVVDDERPTYQNTTGFADITVKATAPEDSVDEIRLFHNGKIVTLTTRNLIVTDNKSETSSKTYQIALLPGSNNIRAVALNTQRTESLPDEVMVNFNSGGAVTNVVKPGPSTDVIISSVDKNATMHLIVVGINQYKNPKMSLNYALADATAFKIEVEKNVKTLISNVKTYFVTDEKADKLGIEQALKEVKKAAKPEDVLIFYYAGHGVISEKNKEFYLVPTDVIDLKNVDEELANHGIPSKLLQQYAIEIAAQKQVFILDACQSAGAFENLLKGDGDQQKSLALVARSTGTHWMAASGSQQFANEFSALGHGAFTYVLLQALKGEAATNKMITVNGLKNFLQLQVPVLMKKYNGSAQYPSSYGLGNDFPVQVMK